MKKKNKQNKRAKPLMYLGLSSTSTKNSFAQKSSATHLSYCVMFVYHTLPERLDIFRAWSKAASA
jgi:hypothetical protein